jgi:glutathione S-transferase
MKLYIKSGACSLSPHIALAEAGLSYEVEQVDLATKITASGADFRQVNPKGSVPALVLDDGQLLTEGSAIVQYIADQKPESGLAPAAGTFERYRLQEWLNYIATELHKGFSPLFNPRYPAEAKEVAKEMLAQRMANVAKQLEGKSYVLGETFTVADGYLFTVLSWAGRVGVDLSSWPVLGEYQARVAARPAVQATLKAEGLL